MINRDALARQRLPEPQQPRRRQERREERSGAKAAGRAAAARPYAVYFPIVMIAVLLAYLIVGRAAYVAELGYEMSAVRSQIQAAEQEVLRLNTQRSSALSVATIDSQASQAQGLLPPRVRWLAAVPPAQAAATGTMQEPATTYVVERDGVRSLGRGEEQWFDLQRRVAASLKPAVGVEASTPE